MSPYLPLGAGVDAARCRSMRPPSPALARLLGEPLQPVELDRAPVVGGEPPRPRAEHLVGLAAELVVADGGVLVEARPQHRLQLPTRVLDPPRLQRIVPVVVPGQLLAELGQPAVHEEAVLGEAGALGPLAADLQPDHVVAA